jgi:methionyl aminopeptidase
MLSAMFRELIPLVKPGLKEIETDQWVRGWIKKAGGKPAFLGYQASLKTPPFPGAICVSVNDGVIHGIPSQRRIREGDLVSLDCGIDLGGFISDQAVSLEMGKVSADVRQLNLITLECLNRATAAVKAGDRILQIARAVEGHAKARGYGVVSTYHGHGVGFDVHEDPIVSNVAEGPNPRMHNGLVIAIEPMINMGSSDVRVLEDNWTVVTADGKVSAHWEHTVAIFNGHAEVLTCPLDQWLK